VSEAPAETLRCDVLVVGGGPVGALMTVLLAQYGVNAIACETSTEVYPLPRAVHLDHEVMRILQAAGIADEIAPHTRPVRIYDFVNAKGDLLMRFDVPEGPASSGWPASNMIHQPSVEHALRRRIAALPNGKLFTGWRCAAVETSSDGVEARFETEGEPRSVRAQYVIGCDGASSFVRKSVDIGLFDLGFDEPWLVIDAVVSDTSKLPDRNLQLCDPARPTTSVLLPAPRHRWEFMLKPDETAEQALDEGFIRDLLAPWKLGDAVAIERKAVYRFHALIATQWRKGRVLLAGDAAHQMPPFAGQGLCSGLRDAHNLAWKLAAVLRGEASETLLDTYQEERGPDVRGYIERALMMGRTVCVLDPVMASARDAAMMEMRARGEAPPAPAPPPISSRAIASGPQAGTLMPQFRAKGGDCGRLDDLLGPNACLITREDKKPDLSSMRVLSLSDPGANAYHADLVAWLDRHGADAVLMRPDRFIFGTGKADALVSAYQSALAA
jgi:3-(3-hydroxy-phenyl)propionate hydroxylase